MPCVGVGALAGSHVYETPDAASAREASRLLGWPE